jgi:hypothetical protein
VRTAIFTIVAAAYSILYVFKYAFCEPSERRGDSNSAIFVTVKDRGRPLGVDLVVRLVLRDVDGVMFKIYVTTVARWLAHADVSNAAQKSEIFDCKEVVRQSGLRVGHWQRRSLAQHFALILTCVGQSCPNSWMVFSRM